MKETLFENSNKKLQQPELTVSEISRKIKFIIDDNIGYVKIRGEVSNLKIASSGHAYFNLKDDNALINAICWSSTYNKLKIKPEEGVEIIAGGVITTYPLQSRYQILVSNISLAGEGALMQLLEKRKKALAAEGLFAQDKKQKLPFLPKVIGVITSPTGAVIEDILHRVRDRFPTNIIIWPVAVQGENSASQVSKAIKGFNIFSGLNFPKPDLLIIARGGGSIEDLWPFNEEQVVRAAFDSKIPIISAIGHETDITLLDYVADKRAPTPTAAAEIALPIREELLVKINEKEFLLKNATYQYLDRYSQRINLFAHSFDNLQYLLAIKTQKLDELSFKLNNSINNYIIRNNHKLANINLYNIHPQNILNIKITKLDYLSQKIKHEIVNYLQAKNLKLVNYSINKNILYNNISYSVRSLENMSANLAKFLSNNFNEKTKQLFYYEQLLNSLNYKKILKRGFAIVKDSNNKLVKNSTNLVKSQKISIEFSDGIKQAIINNDN